MVKARQFEASSRIASVHAQPPSGAQVSGSGGAAGGELTTLTWQSASLVSPHRMDPLQLVDAQHARPSGQSAAVAHGVHGAVPKPYSLHCVAHQLVIAPPPVVVPVPPAEGKGGDGDGDGGEGEGEGGGNGKGGSGRESC